MFISLCRKQSKEKNVLVCVIVFQVDNMFNFSSEYLNLRN